MEVYLDNAATTKPSSNVIKKIAKSLENHWANPSSLHTKGVEAEVVLEESRGVLADTLNVKKEELFFSSSGTLSNNLAIRGAVDALKRRGNHIITTSVEHSSVKKTMKALENEGFKVTYLKPSLINDDLLENVLKNLTDETILISIMMVNNEIGQYFDVFNIAGEVKKRNNLTIFHTDGVQAFLKYKINLKNSSIDLFSFSGHKIHAPKGVAGLYIKKGIRINPIIFGGQQEGGHFPGTQNVCFASAMGDAVLEQKDNIADNFTKTEILNKYVKEEILKIKNGFVNLSKKSSPYILSGGIMGIRSEILLHYLGGKNVFVSSGSACSSETKSPVLKAYGFDDATCDSTIRISFSHSTTRNDVEYLIKNLRQAAIDIRRA